MLGGMATPGFTSVWNVPRISPPRTFTAPTSVMASVPLDPPVVSRSSTQNVTSRSGVPRSSNDRCTTATKGTYVRSRRMSRLFFVTRYRCAACGNLTRFDVTSTRRTRAFHHYTVGGELTVEDEQVLSEVVEEVSCR